MLGQEPGGRRGGGSWRTGRLECPTVYREGVWQRTLPTRAKVREAKRRAVGPEGKNTGGCLREPPTEEGKLWRKPAHGAGKARLRSRARSRKREAEVRQREDPAAQERTNRRGPLGAPHFCGAGKALSRSYLSQSFLPPQTRKKAREREEGGARIGVREAAGSANKMTGGWLENEVARARWRTERGRRSRARRSPAHRAGLT